MTTRPQRLVQVVHDLRVLDVVKVVSFQQAGCDQALLKFIGADLGQRDLRAFSSRPRNLFRPRIATN